MKRKIDPAAECIRYLTQKYCVPDPPDSVVVQNCRDFARSYRIPQAELEELTAPLLPLEAELDQVMAEHRSLWEEMFYPGAEEENLLAWGLYMLARQGGPEALPPEKSNAVSAGYSVHLDANASYSMRASPVSGSLSAR